MSRINNQYTAEENFIRIDEWIDEHREDMVRDIKRIVKIPSISEEGAEGYPFGKGCKDALDEMLAMGREHGFFTENYENYMGSIGQEKKNLKNTIGLWNHLDVVPLGNNWQYDPFEVTYREPFMIGRGVNDNKGPTIGMLYLMKCFRELNIPLTHELCLYLGCNEEKGMKDVAYYTEHYETPALSIVADSAFPVCYGEKGIIDGAMVTKDTVSDHIVMVQGGIASNMIPDIACAELVGDEEFVTKVVQELKLYGNEDVEVVVEKDKVTVAYHGISRHSAHPYGSKNAVHGLCSTLAELSALPKSDKKIFLSIAELSSEYLGEVPGIAFKDEVSGNTTCAVTMLHLWERKLYATVNIRYAITADSDRDMAALNTYGENHELTWVLRRNSKPNYFPRENPIVDLLTDVFNQAVGENRDPYVMGGGTYARKLPNAFAYGLGGVRESEKDSTLQKQYIIQGHGGAHEPDEVLNMNTFIAGIKIFARAILSLNDIEI